MLSDVMRAGRKRAQDTILRGPRGVGKTVLLSRFEELARQQGFDTINLQAASGWTGVIQGILERSEDHLREQQPAWHRAKSALERLGTISLSTITVGATIGLHPTRGQNRTIDPGTLAHSLATLANEISTENSKGGLLITLDEMQMADAADLSLLAAALHRLNVEHPTAPVLFAASALPNINDALRDAGVTHPDRLFIVEPLPVELAAPDARYAISEPARRLSITWADPAVDAILETTHQYPAHLQLFADRTWKRAAGPTEITLGDARVGIADAQAHVEIQTLEPRWLRATDRQTELLAALAAITSATTDTPRDYATTNQISTVLARAVNEWSATRVELINEGDIYAPRRGRLAFTIPTYAAYILENYEPRRLEAHLHLTPLTQILSAIDRLKDELA